MHISQLPQSKWQEKNNHAIKGMYYYIAKHVNVLIAAGSEQASCYSYLLFLFVSLFDIRKSIYKALLKKQAVCYYPKSSSFCIQGVLLVSPAVLLTQPDWENTMRCSILAGPKAAPIM